MGARGRLVVIIGIILLIPACRLSPNGILPFQASGISTSTSGHLVFATLPPSEAAGTSPFSTPPVVAIKDFSGNLLSNFGSSTVVLNAFIDANCTQSAPISLTGNSANLGASIASFPSAQYSPPSSATIYLQASIPGQSAIASSFCSTAVHIFVPQVSVASDSACALSSTGNVYCWGNNVYGQLGNNTTAESDTPVLVSGVGGTSVLDKIFSISAKDADTYCALSYEGYVYCWGYNQYGQVGNNTTYTSLTPTQVLGPNGEGVLENIVSVSVGQATSCAVSASGSAYCWGLNNNGQLGINSTTDSLVPVPVFQGEGPGMNGYLSQVTSIAVGDQFTCAIAASNVYCWGDNNSAQLGDHNTSESNVPQAVLSNSNVPLSGATSLALSSGSACALNSSGTTVCWGDNNDGQLTDTAEGNSLLQYYISADSMLNGSSFIAGGNNQFCALNEGTAYCWGLNSGNSLGNYPANGVTPSSAVPLVVSGVTGSGSLPAVTSISMGGGIGCAVSGNNVYCWGYYNSYGQDGIGSVGAGPVMPTLVEGVGGQGVLSL